MKTEENLESTALIVQGPTGLVVDQVAVDAMYAGIKTEIESFEYDLMTIAGRKRVASLAAGIARRKTSIEADKKALKEGLLKQGRAIDGAWNEIKAKLEGYQEQARAPLTKWERDEEFRTETIRCAFDYFRCVVITKASDTSETIERLLSQARGFAIDEIVFQDMYQPALGAKDVAVRSLRASLDKLLEDEFDRQELARLRKKDEERQEQDRIAVEAAELARLNREREERESVRLREKEEARLKAEEDRKAREAKIAEDAKIEAENRVRREFEESQRKERERLQAALDKEKKDRAVAEAAHAYAARVLLIENEKKAEAERKLAANKKHQAAIKGVAEAALRERCGLNEKQAKDVVTAIVAGWIPGVSISFRRVRLSGIASTVGRHERNEAITSPTLNSLPDNRIS